MISVSTFLSLCLTFKYLTHLELILTYSVTHGCSFYLFLFILLVATLLS